VSELPEGIPPAEVVRARDSAAAIVLRPGGGGSREVLLGLRSARSRFMPGHLAFPGGAVDAADEPGLAGAFARCAARELAEETGLRVEAQAWLEAGERVTPPLFPVRFRTHFFVADRAAVQGPADPHPASAENDRLEFVDPARAVRDWEAGRSRIPPPVLPILRALAGLAPGASAGVAARAIASVNAGEERAPRIEFVPQVWMLPVRTATLPPATHTNVWMPGMRRFVIVDPGSPDEVELGRLLEVVARRRDLGETPAAVLLTHHHRDHTAGAVRLARILGLPIRAEARCLQTLAAGRDGPALEPLSGGDELDLAGLRLRAVATPGHARDHLAFHVPERRLLLGGDLVSGLSTILIDPDHGDMEQYLASLALAQALGCDTILPGHGPPLPASHLATVIDHRRQREARLRAELGRHPVELADLARAVYADTPGLPARLTERQTLSHLVALEKRGEVWREDAAGSRWRSGAGSG
jgi:glyoxylase-like metal-dependent hydrolase (beta-lactamase superfamily II)/8-oxo-dGTP pyrophosphatase MutT (NUDIX family)